MPFSTPNIFVGGTTAKAVEMNENFEAVKKELNKHLEGISETKALVEGVEEGFDSLKDDIVDIVRSAKTKFSVNSGSYDSSGNPSLFSYSGKTLTVKAPFEYTNTKGILFKQEDDLSITLSGSCNIAVNNASLEVIGNIYRQATEPDFVMDGACILEAPNGVATYSGTSIMPKPGLKVLIPSGKSSGNFLWTVATANPEYVYPNGLSNMNGTLFLVANGGFSHYQSNRVFKLKNVQNNISGYRERQYSEDEHLWYTVEPDNTKAVTNITEIATIVTGAGSTITSLTPFTPQNGMPVWLNTSGEPLNAYKLDDDGIFQPYDGVPLGSVVMSSSAITSVTTFPYNQNGYSINTQTPELVNNWRNAYPDYKKGVNKAWNTTHTATQNGFIVAYFNPGPVTLTINDVLMGSNSRTYHHDNGTLELTVIFPIGIGDKYKITGGLGTPKLTFYPARGEN